MNLSVLIGTCDRYSPLWEPFQITFDRYWKFDSKNIFVGETIEIPKYTNTNFTTILSDKKTWAGRMLEGIELCDSEYIFFILDDYFFDYVYTEENMSTWIKDMVSIHHGILN